MMVETLGCCMIMTAGQHSTLELHCTTYTHSRPKLQVINNPQKEEGNSHSIHHILYKQK